MPASPAPASAPLVLAPLTVGTAGHIDHGKTWLVTALTGKDTDRLPEERRRGISIDLGYAPLELGDGRVLSVIDVPGHERFIRNMVAGATGIDLFLLVIDACEGPREQTHEHLAIIRLLGIDAGVVAVTKADAVAAEALESAVGRAQRLVPGAEAIAVSARTGAGLPELLRALGRAADRVVPAPRSGPTRLFVDRTFTLRGIGTVVTGSLRSGSIAEGDDLRLEPAGVPVRVRSVEVHDRSVMRAEAGQRVAVGVPGLERGRIGRGDVLVAPGAFPVSYRLDVVLDELQPIADGAHASVHHGAAEIPARVVRVGERHAQLRLATPVVAARGDRVVLRAGATLGGARVLDPAPLRARDPARLELLERGDPASIVRAVVREPVRRSTLEGRALLGPTELDEGLRALERAGEWYIPLLWLEECRAAVRHRLEEHARRAPLDPGLPLGELLPPEPWAGSVAALLNVERRGGKAYLPGTGASLGDRSETAERVEADLATAGFEPVRVTDRELARYLEREGRLVRVGENLAVGRAAYERARALLVEEAGRAGAVRLARYRDLLGTSRRTAQTLLERFDADGVTRRVGDERVLRRSARPPG